MATSNLNKEDWDLSSLESATQIPSNIDNNQSATSNVATNTIDTSGWNIPDYIQNYDDPSTIRKIQYGAAQETYLLGDVWRLTKSAFEAAIGPDSFAEEREETEEERLQKIYDNFPEFKSGRFDNDMAVWGGRSLIMLTDPVYMLMPWSRAAQAGKLYKGWKKYGAATGALAGLGGTVGAADMAIREFARTGKVTPRNVAIGATAGAVLSPAFLGIQKVGAMGLNKLFPQLFKNKQMQKEVTDVLHGIHKNKYNLNDKQLQNVYNISKDKNIIKLFQDIDGAENVYKNYLKPKEELTALVQGIKEASKKGTKIRLKTFNFQGKKYNVRNYKERKILSKEINKKMGEALKDQARKESKLQIEIVKQLHSAGGLTSRTTRQIARMMTTNLARPAFGGAGGAVYGTLFTDSDEGFWRAVGAGVGIGITHKVLMRGGIKGVPTTVQKELGQGIVKNYLSNLDRFTRITMAMTQQSKLTQRGPILDEFSNLFFARPTDTVRLNMWGKVAKNQDESLGLIGSGNSVEELAERRFALLADDIYTNVVAGASRDVQADAIKIVRGFKGKTSSEAKDLAKRIKNFLGDFRAYYKNVGFSEKEMLINYFPRKFNFKLIANNREEFQKDIVKIIDNLKRDKKSKYFKDKRKSDDIAEEYINSVQRTHTDPIIDFKKATGGVEYSNTYNFKLPMSQHIELERALQGSYKDVESILGKWTVNEADKVLLDVVRTSVKSIEFARVFGKHGQGFKTFLDRLNDQYAKSGFKKVRGFYGTNPEGAGSPHRNDVEAMHNAVNSFFNRYGRKGTEGEKLTAAWLSTMANFSMMDKVTIANLGDLIQPFQNSRHWLSAIQGIFGGQGISRQMAQKFAQGTKQSFKDAYYSDTTGSTPYAIGNKGGSVRSLLGIANEKFFKFIGLEAVTNMARRYAYNVGAIDTFKTAKRLALRLQKTGGKSLNDLTDSTSLKDINHLIKTGALKVGKDGKTILNQSDIINFGRVKNFDEAMQQSSLANLIDRVGTKTANRDAIIPTVGNRLLFTQTRNPLVRLIGQFSSWAMAKSAQTNAMMTRVESGDLRTAIGMLSALTAFGAVKDLRDYVKWGEWDTVDNLEDDPQTWWSEAAMLSGNLGWLSQTMVNSFVRFKGGSPIEFFPAISYASDVASGGKNAVMAGLNMQDWDKAIRDFYRVMPVPTLRAILDRMGVPYMAYHKDFNINQDYDKKKILKPSMFAEGGLATQSRKLFATGDIVKEEKENKDEISFSNSFNKARNNREELFMWKGNPHTTRKADESDEQYKNFLGVDKLDKDVVLKTNHTPIEEKVFEEVTEDAPENKPVKVIVKQKPIRIFNNPVNVERTQNWAGSLEKGYGENERFAIFDNPIMGIRAGIRDINTKVDRLDGDVSKIIKSFAPKEENKYLNNYINFVKNKIGKDIITKADVPNVIKAMIEFENKPSVARYYLDNPEWFDEAIRLEKFDLDKSYRYVDENRKEFHGGGMAHTHGPKKSKPKKSSWKSLFTSNQAYGGPTPPVQSSSSSNNNDNKGKYIASTKGGTTTKPPKTIVKSSGSGGDDDDKTIVTDKKDDDNKIPKRKYKKIGDSDLYGGWHTNIFPNTLQEGQDLFYEGFNVGAGLGGDIGGGNILAAGASLQSGAMLEGKRMLTDELPDVNVEPIQILKKNFETVPSELPTTGDINQGSASIHGGLLGKNYNIMGEYNTTTGAEVTGSYSGDTFDIGDKTFAPVVTGGVTDEGETKGSATVTTNLFNAIPITFGVKKEYGDNVEGYIGTKLPFKSGGLLDRKRLK